MVTKKQSLENFQIKISAMASSNYFLADKNITDLLKCMTASKLFFELISFCIEDYDFDADKVAVFHDGQYFAPNDKKRLIAFCFIFLTQIDSKEINLLDILNNYFPSDGLAGSYSKFCSQLILPFSQAVMDVASILAGDVPISAFNDSCDAGLVDAGSVQGEHSSRKNNYLKCYSDIQAIIVEEFEKIEHCRSLHEDEKEELVFILTSLKTCLFYGQNDQVKLAYLAYKYAAINYEKLNSEYAYIGRILKFCELI